MAVEAVVLSDKEGKPYDYRVAFVTLDEPKAFEEKGTPKYSVTLLVPKDKPEMLLPVRRLLKAAIVEKWGEDRKKWPANLRDLDFKSEISKTGKDGWPIRDGNMVDWDGFEDHWFVRCGSTLQPGVVDSKARAILNIKNDCQSGMFVRVQVNAFAYTTGTPGASIGLNNVQFTKDDGVRFGGRQDPTGVFEAVDSGEDDADNYGSDEDL